VQNPTQVSHTNASGIQSDPGSKKTDAINSFSENLPIKREHRAGPAEATEGFRKASMLKGKLEMFHNI